MNYQRTYVVAVLGGRRVHRGTEKQTDCEDEPRRGPRFRAIPAESLGLWLAKGNICPRCFSPAERQRLAAIPATEGDRA